MPIARPWFNTVEALDGHRVFVSWFPLSPDSVRGVLRGYRVYYESNVTEQTKSVTVKPDQLQVELTNLDSSTEYRISITAFTTAGEGPQGYGLWMRTSKWNATSCSFW